MSAERKTNPRRGLRKVKKIDKRTRSVFDENVIRKKLTRRKTKS